MFLREHFGNLAPIPVEYLAMVLGRLREFSLTGVKSTYKARALRWVGIKQLANKSLAAIIDKENNFNFKPYLYVPTGIHGVGSIFSMSWVQMWT